MTRIYLDTNIVSYLQHPEHYLSEPWQNDAYALRSYLEHAENIEVVYSPAHLMDMRKGYVKDELLAIEKLRFISNITRNRRIAKYMGSSEIVMERVDPEAFFFEKNAINAEFHVPGDEKLDYAAWVRENPVYEKLKNYKFDLVRLKETFTNFPVPLTESEKEPTVLNLMCDFAAFVGEMINHDFSLYKPLRAQAMQETGMTGRLAGSLDPLSILLPMLMETDTGRRVLQGMYEMMAEKDPEGIIFGLFMNLDFMGFEKDKIAGNHGYMNLTTDATHCFYASYCDFFVTNDERTGKKSAAIYTYLGIDTKVMDMRKFAEWGNRKK